MARHASLVEIDAQAARALHRAMPERLYAALKHAILTGRLAPGGRIVEAGLCEEFQVSRTPLREALNRLAQEGLLVLSPYKGYSVTPLTVAHFRELCELRRILEPGAAALAARRSTPALVAELEALAEITYTPGDAASYANYLRTNGLFHLRLARATGNGLLEGMVMSALDRHQRPCYLGLDGGIDAATSSREHFAIVAAIRAGDAAEAARLMEHHIASGEERICAALVAAGYP
jgi:DNA-binding GntR family transcriptional regulator